MVADAVAMDRAQLDSVGHALDSANQDPNAPEVQFRILVVAAEGAAVKQNKLEVAKAVKDVLRVFSM